MVHSYDPVIMGNGIQHSVTARISAAVEGALARMNGALGLQYTALVDRVVGYLEFGGDFSVYAQQEFLQSIELSS